MTNKEKQLSALKHKLRNKKENREKEVIWKLSIVQKEYIEQLGYTLVPWIYEIITKSIIDVKRAKAPIIREVHYANKRGQKKMYRKLKSQELRSLNEYGVNYYPYKYKIILQ